MQKQVFFLNAKQETAKDGMAGLQSGNKIWEDWLRTSLKAMVNLRYCMTLKSANKIWEDPLRTNLNAKVYLHVTEVNQNYYVTLNRKSEGQGHRERSQFRRSHKGLFPCKVSSLYWLMPPRTNLNAKVNQNY